MDKPRFRKGDIITYSPHGYDRSTYTVLCREHYTYHLGRWHWQGDKLLVAIGNNKSYRSNAYIDCMSVGEIDTMGIFLGRDEATIKALYF